MLDPLRIVTAHASDTSLEQINLTLHERHVRVAACTSAAELIGAARAHTPDLIVAGAEFPDGSGIDALVSLSRESPIPAVIVTPQSSIDLVARAIEDHIMAYLIEPVHPEALEASVVLAWNRYRQLRELEQEVGELRQALADRKVIERAKGILMAKENIDEAQAFAALRNRAQNTRRKLADAARDVLDSNQSAPM